MFSFTSGLLYKQAISETPWPSIRRPTCSSLDITGKSPLPHQDWMSARENPVFPSSQDMFGSWRPVLLALHPVMLGTGSVLRKGAWSWTALNFLSFLILLEALRYFDFCPHPPASAFLKIARKSLISRPSVLVLIAASISLNLCLPFGTIKLVFLSRPQQPSSCGFEVLGQCHIRKKACGSEHPSVVYSHFLLVSP